MSLIHLAVKHRNPLAVEKLIQINRVIENWGVDKDKNTPLHLAARNSLILDHFIHGEYTASFINLQHYIGLRHLHDFAYERDLRWVKKLLGYSGVEVDARCQGYSPFFISIIEGNVAVAQLLMENGANINLGNYHGMTALHFSAFTGMVNCLEKLIKWGADLEKKTTRGATPLISATRWGHRKIVERLLWSGANVNAVDRDGFTALHHATKRKKYDIIAILKRNGADANIGKAQMKLTSKTCQETFLHFSITDRKFLPMYLPTPLLYCIPRIYEFNCPVRPVVYCINSPASKLYCWLTSLPLISIGNKMNSEEKGMKGEEGKKETGTKKKERAFGKQKMNLEEGDTKKPEGNLGKPYERQITTLIALKCLLTDDIRDFWLMTNYFQIEKFDDLVLHVEYEDNRKELFFMQIKHKKSKGKESPIHIKMFRNNQKDFCLEMYEKAFEELMDKSDFFTSNNISEEAKRFFILYSHCKVETEFKDPEFRFLPVEKDNFRCFISSKASQEVSSEYKIKEKETRADFLSMFYFYGDQLHSRDVPYEIRKVTGLNSDIVNSILTYFYDFAESTNTVEKLHKLDIQTKLLGYIFGDFIPPIVQSEHRSILDSFPTCSAVIISENDSELAIWSEILEQMRIHYQESTLKLQNWEEPLTDNLQEKMRPRFNLSVDEKINTKYLYLHLVAKQQLPFYIKTENRSLASRVKVQLQGKKEITLCSQIRNDASLRKEISIDLLISLLDNIVTIGSQSEETEIYIDRKLKLQVVDESILENGEYLFIISGLSSLEMFDCMSLDLYLRMIEMGIDVLEEVDYERAFPILTTVEPFNKSRLMEAIKKIPDVDRYCFLQYVNEKDGKNRFILMETNGSLKVLRPGICENEYYRISDTELLRNNLNSKINIICNNAGMGKTSLLSHISRKFSPQDWVVHLELGKFSSEIKKIVDFNRFEEFVYNIEIKTVEERYQGILKLFYHHQITNGRMVLLIDDYEEINSSKLLEILKIGVDRGLRIWIVGRPFLKMELEETFEALSMELVEFSTEDQNNFFRKFFSRNGNSSDIQRKLSLIYKTRIKLEKSFIGICQQTMMLAMVVDSDEQLIGDYLRIDDLYEQFINLQIIEPNPKNMKFILRTLSKLALYSFFTENLLGNIFEWDEFHDDVEVFKEGNTKSALITEFQRNNYPIFSHKTYAEFLAARWLADIVIKQIEKKTTYNIERVLRLLYCQELTNVRLFFDNILTHNKPTHSAIINSDITEEIWNRDDGIDPLGRNIFHMIMSYGTRYQIHSASGLKEVLHNMDDRAYTHKEGNLLVLKIPELTIELKPNIMRKVFLFHTSMKIIQPDKLGINAIEYALMSGSLAELELLLKRDPTISNWSVTCFAGLNSEIVNFIFIHCIMNKFDAIFTELAQNAQNMIRIREFSTRMSLLHLAVEYDNPNAVEKLIHINSVMENWGVDKDKNSPLHLASQSENSLILDHFIHGKYTISFINLKNSKGFTHLHCLAYQGNIKWVEKLLGYSGVEVDARCDQGNSPFIISIKEENIAVAQQLMENGANINLGNNHGMTALHFSASTGMFKCAKKLIEWGAHLDMKTTYGATPLIKAASWGHRRIVARLLLSGAKINAVDRNGWTALHHATKRKKYDVIEILMRNGADATKVSSNGQTPLITACLHDVPAAIDILKRYSGRINTDYYSKIERGTALDIAKRKGHKRCLHYLGKMGKMNILRDVLTNARQECLLPTFLIKSIVFQQQASIVEGSGYSSSSDSEYSDDEDFFSNSDSDFTDEDL
ncbi:hypothetical protein JTB14_020717 [Gonioctena quinquepunctata]|nr:hypothetical protein JTB14_020717 [Gonioctena quinquepunctata]